MAIAESRVVPASALHRHIQGDNVMKYDKTIKIGNTTVHYVAPPPMTVEEIKKILDEINVAAWEIIDEIIEKEDTEEHSGKSGKKLYK